jgi:kynureninase
MSIDRETADKLDARDPLAPWRSEFVINDPELIYLDGNSLGMTPKRTVTALHEAVEQQWAGDLISSWWEHDWLNLPLTVGDLLSPLVGAASGEVAVHDSTTVCIFQLINVALDLDGAVHPDPGHSTPVIAFEPTEFPTDRYAAEGIARLRSGAVQVGLDDLSNVDVVVRSMVDYRTAEIADVAAENERARAAGARTVWDLSHAAGVLDLDLPALGVELAVGCTYKFLNGGPGSPAFTYVSAALHDQLVQPIWGWFGQANQFAMDNPFDPRPGIGRMLHGTPGVLGLIGAREGIRLSAEAGIEAIAAKARAVTGFGLEVADQLGLSTNTPLDDKRRGGHVSILHPDATRLQQELAARKVIVDKRDPDVLRLGMSPLTTRFTDVFDALTLLADLSR